MEANDVIRELFQIINGMNSQTRVQDAVVHALKTEHRTLQQSFFRYVVIPAILKLADDYDRGFYDERNEGACRAAKEMKAVAEKAYLPFI